MHKAVLAAVAAAALIAPAVAQQTNTNGPSQTSGPPQTREDTPSQPRPVPRPSPSMASRAIAPELLSTRQIRDIQQALEARGARSIRIDGHWGPDIETAIRNFQKSENMISQNGELDPLTLMALGLDPLSFGLSGTNEATGQAARDGAAPRDRMEDTPESQPVPIPGGDDPDE